MKKPIVDWPAINSSSQFIYLFPFYLFINITYKKKKES